MLSGVAVHPDGVWTPAAVGMAEDPTLACACPQSWNKHHKILVSNFFIFKYSHNKNLYSQEVFNLVHRISHPSIFLFHSSTNLSQGMVIYLVQVCQVGKNIDMDGPP